MQHRQTRTISDRSFKCDMCGLKFVSKDEEEVQKTSKEIGIKDLNPELVGVLCNQCFSNLMRDARITFH